MPSVKALGLYDLLAPQFLAGFQFPDYIDKYLSLLAVAEFETTSDANGTLYTGTVFFPSAPGQPPVLTHQDPSGAVFDFHDITLGFRLLIPRAASSPIKTVIDTAAMSSSFAPFQQVANALGTQTSPTDYPGIGFQLDLLLTVLTFHLGDDWKPGKLNSDFTISVDPNATSQDVKILLPKILFRYTQGQDFTQAPSFKVVGWGNPGFDAPNDLAEGEVGTMSPPLAISTSGKWAFGIDTVIFDDSTTDTPAEVLDYFGVDQDFTGVYIKKLQLYYCDTNKDFALNVVITDALVSFAGKVWLEAEVDVMFSDAPFTVALTAYDGNTSLAVNAGTASGTTWTGGSITMPPNGVIYVQVQGGTPPFTYTADFTPTGGSVVHMWDNTARAAKFATPPTTSESGTLVIHVTDSSATPLTYQNTLTLNVVVGSAAAALPTPAVAQAKWNPDPRPAGIPDEDQIQFTPAASGTSETLVIQGGTDTPLPTVKIGGTPYALGPDRQVIATVPAGGSPVQVEVDYTSASLPSTFNLLFAYDQPATEALESNYYGSGGPPDPVPPQDTVFPGNTVPDGVPGGEGHTGADALRFWVANALQPGSAINIHAEASNEDHDDKVPYNQSLSQRRADVAKAIIAQVPGAATPTVTATGQVGNAPTSNASDRVAIITGTAKNSTAYTLTGNLTRAATPTPTPPPATVPPTAPGPPSNTKPTTLRRLSIRFRLEKNIPVMVEVSGEIDFETDMESSLRNASGDNTSTLGLTQTPAASKNPNPADGVVDFTLNVTYDLATHDLTETLTLGAAPADIDGLLQMQNPAPYNRLKDILGSVLIFTPILNAATTALDPASAGDWEAVAVDLAVPVAIGALGFINTTTVTLYGGTLQLKENIPGGSDPAKFTNASLTFDYGVAFRIDIDALDIHSSRSMSVRYKAVGVNLHFGDPAKFQFVLDTSKGYTLDLSDPALFNLPSPLGDLLKIAAARIARFNPLTLELDLEIKADLGIITVDKFMVKVPLDGSSAPMILPSGIKVNIPGAITGSGSVTILSGGFEGTIDITLVPVKLRIAASVGVQHISQPPREATAFYLGLEVDFPAPIILGSTGLGLFGLFGLFAMNYDRILPAPIPGDAVGPDLKWLMSSNGQPQQLQVGGTHLWGPKLDNWAFGVGVLLGTVDGFLLNLRGMFLLELPGPRIIITVNLGFVESLPGVSSDGMDATSLDVGIIGILDIDIGAGQITLGVMINLAISSLITIKIPIQLFFDWNTPSNWHFWLGTIQTPCSANILGIVQGSGYFMIGGQAITPFPPGATGNPVPALPGTAVALGFGASIIWGSTSVDIYLKVAVSADFGVSFSPHLFIVGQVHLEGELRLLIISIGATGDFLLTAPDPLFLHVHVCGHISFFFFSISACVDFSIGTQADPPPPPSLVSRMYLQSFAPVIAQGQGDRPIDASLGNAIITAASGDLPSLTVPSNQGAVPVVPINAVPVLQMSYGVDASTITQTFTKPIPACVTYPGNPGVNLGGKRTARYELTKLILDPPLPAGVLPPTAWRPNKPATDTSQTQVDLALFSRNPAVTNSAAERSTELTNNMLSIWGDTCGAIAPPTSVFWGFCGQRVGTSPNGWTLHGIVLPDPPNTNRTSPVPTMMVVEQPSLSSSEALLLKMGLPLTGQGLYPAQVIGLGGVSSAAPVTFAAVVVNSYPCWRALELPELLKFDIKSDISSTFGANGDVAGALARINALVANNRWIRLHTGQSTHISLLLGLNIELIRTQTTSQILIRERDSSGKLLKETPLSSMSPVTVTAITALPAEWNATTSPWYVDTNSVLGFLKQESLAPLFIQFKPQPTTTVIEVAAATTAPYNITVVIAAIASTPLSEVNRAQNGEIIQQSTIQSIQSYLDGGTPVPLLATNTTYTVTLDYDVVTTEEDGSTHTYSNNTESFQFKTDNKPPASLESWVLCSFPAQSDTFCFYNDPVDVIFNDNSIIQLFGAYGYQLEIDLRAADGLPDVKGAPVTTTSVSGVGTAAYDTMQQMVASGKLPCVGLTLGYQNQKFTAPVSLRPLMGYTLDINTSPASPAPPAGAPITPLFRRSFSTGRYANMKAFAADLGATLITHRPLNQKLSFAPTGGAILVTPDQDIQTAFMTAGEQALPAPDKNEIVIYWAQSGTTWVPHAILIDSVEPLWRTRPEPGFTNPIPSDPSFKLVTISGVPSLELKEHGSSNIGGYVTSPGGTRTVAIFGAAFVPPAAGAPLNLVLHRPASTVYGNADEVESIFTVTVLPHAPWENDHV
jgi:hypothetical protein